MSEPINRLDPQWGMFAAAVMPSYFTEDFGFVDRVANACDYADAMIRERDRRCADEGLLAHIEGMPDKTCNCDELREALEAVMACPVLLDENGRQYIKVDARAINGTGAMAARALANAHQIGEQP